MSKKILLPLRIGVGVIVLNEKNRVFVGKRKDNPVDKWQMPQGGVNEGEKLIDPIEGNKKLNIPKNTPFSAIDGNTFACPVCRAGKNLYKDIGPREKPSGFEENLTYGFGFNSLPPGQKNILIFGGLAFAAACFLSLYSLH